MFSRKWGIAAIGVVASVAGIRPAQAWYGPFCYSNKARSVSLTVPTMAGEMPGDIKVTFDDNDGKARLVAARASTKVKNAHEIVLARDDDSRSGIFGVIVTGGRSSFGYKFELEFRDDPSDCTGAIIKVSDKFAGDIGGSESPPAPVKISAKRHEARPVIAPVNTAEKSEAESETAAPAELVGPERPVGNDVSDTPMPATEDEPKPRANDAMPPAATKSPDAEPAKSSGDSSKSSSENSPGNSLKNSPEYTPENTPKSTEDTSVKQDLPVKQDPAAATDSPVKADSSSDRTSSTKQASVPKPETAPANATGASTFSSEPVRDSGASVEVPESE